MNIIHSSAHIVNVEEDFAKSRKTPEEFQEYVETLLEQIENNEKIRNYIPKSQETIINNYINNIVSKYLDVKVVNLELDKIASKLLGAEKNTQELYLTKLKRKIQKGTLIQALIENSNGEYRFLLAKVEHSTWIDEDDYKRKFGFPGDAAKIWKTCIFDIKIENGNVSIQTARVFLNNDAKYWYDDFLELEPVLSNQVNTKRAYASINHTLKISLQGKYPEDFKLLGYSFTNKMLKAEYVDYDEMVSSALDNYYSDSLPKEKLADLKEALLILPKKNSFDNQFTLVPKEIRNNFKKTYKIIEGINLKLSAAPEIVDKNIEAHQDKDGTYYLKIKTDNIALVKRYLINK